MNSTEQNQVSKNERLPLSVICTSASEKITERIQNRLLRPIFINGVEVGFAYSKGANSVKKLSARGITISLWYFISRGHQAQALLPYCFKSYPDKLNQWDELMTLYRMNLIEFTPGFGSDKYVEVNRIVAMRAREYGGCMVARSQMHIIVEQDPRLDRTVEQKLLMPAFNGDDIIFPIDGPLGRKGRTFAETLICTMDDPEWSRCVLQQMSLRDQRIWMTNLADVVQNSQWITTAGKVCRHQSSHFVSIPSDPSPVEEPIFELHPPETNPPENRGFSKLRYRVRRNRFSDDNGNHRRSSYNNSYMDHCSNNRKNWTSNHNIFGGNCYFVPSYRKNTRKFDKKVSYIGRPNSIYRLHTPSHIPASTKNGGPISEQKVVAADNRSNNVYGHNNLKTISNRNPKLFGTKDNTDELAQVVQKTEKEEENDGFTKEQKQKEKQQEQEHEKNKNLEGGKELLEVSDSLEKIIKHSMNEDGEEDAYVTAPEHQLVSLHGDLPLEFGLNKFVVSSSYDAQLVVVKTANSDNENDLIHFSDYELENDDSLRETEILM